ncbi:MAG TPA: methyltransferase domain-containing protein [Bacteroidia bacterium]|nr:methyltransferase domain-containing protein [Bacteroidia bacterium]
MGYESEVLRDWYLLFHYGAPEEILHGIGFDPAGLPPRCLEFPAATVEAADLSGPVSRALDLGCAVGRSAFELSRIADEVLGIDYSSAFVAAAESIRRDGTAAYHRYGEMHRKEPLVARRPDGTHPERIAFETGDAMHLRDDLGDFDLVHAANLLCRLPEPAKFLDRLPRLVRRGGQLVLATPATWLEAYTPLPRQPEGPTLEYLKQHLGGNFDLVSVAELPFLIREHQRKFQLSTSQTSVWVRR